MTLVPFCYTLTENNIIVGSLYVIQGAVLGMAAPATYSILSRSVEVRKRGESTGLAAAVFTLGGGIGAAIVGYILSNTGSYDVVFYLYSGGILLTLIYLIFKIQKVKLHHSNCNGKKKAIREEIKKCSSKYKIIMLCAIAFLGDYICGCVVALFHF